MQVAFSLDNCIAERESQRVEEQNRGLVFKSFVLMIVRIGKDCLVSYMRAVKFLGMKKL